MGDSAGELTFAFGADFSGFTREVSSAGARLDALAAAAARLPSAVQGPLRSTSTGTGDSSTKVLSQLTEQLALLQSTGAAHDAIALRMKIETEEAKLGTDATLAQKQAVAGLVTQIDAAKASQKALTRQQGAVNDAWTLGADAITRGFDSVILRGQRLQDVARSLLTSFAQQGLSAALTGGGSFAGLFGTKGQSGQTGGLFGALQTLFSGGLGGSSGSGVSSINAAFSGLYANGGSIDAGRWGIVGERGAEVVAGPATVTPWNKLPASRAVASAPSQTINFNVTSPDAPSFARSETQIAAVLARAVARGQRNA